ncbi:nucleoside phosphorylase [Bacillus massilinigeriensis]|uniref:nucleoside phosphorylase n=1 Tax=Bacillus mediterraneensis TaxID=1805474 RepID=UPI0008F9233E|nr:nucleoside phosphorylase [Bacillus mediterraneensis]
MSIHLKNLKPGDLGEATIVVGDPGRVLLISEKWENKKEVSNSREFLLINGYYKGHLVSVCSTGIGVGSTEIAVTELIENGAKQIVRCGGCGAWDQTINPGDIILNSGMQRSSGMFSSYVPETYPAVADPLLLSKINQSLVKNNQKVHVGLGLTTETYYLGQGRAPKINSELPIPNIVEDYNKFNIINCEMESAVLFLLGSIYNIPVANCLVVHVSRSTEKWVEDKDYNKIHQNTSEFVLDALLNL